MEDIEYLLLQKNECKAYEVPPVVRAAGHLAEEWKNCILQGKLKVIGKGKLCYVQLLTRDNQLFLSCEVNPLAIERSVERCKDSSRYFVLTVTAPNGAKINIGMGFDERNDAFDFWATLLDFAERTKNAEKPVVETAGPDLSHLQMREGQTFSLGGSSKPGGSGGALFRLKPPPK